MVSEQPPNESVGEIEAVLGGDATREIVRLFLGGFPESFRSLGAGNREDQLRMIHGLKSSALHMGATGMSERLAALEARLNAEEEAITPQDLAGILSDFGAVEPALRRYAGK